MLLELLPLTALADRLHSSYPPPPPHHSPEKFLSVPVYFIHSLKFQNSGGTIQLAEPWSYGQARAPARKWHLSSHV